MSSLYRRPRGSSHGGGGGSSTAGTGRPSPLAAIHDRDAFFKAQLTAVAKALTPTEAPVKEKHVRTLILGTHQEHGAGTFWAGVVRTQLETNRFLSWKFCYVFHKLARDGQENVLVDSMKYKTRIRDLGSLWSHLRQDVYGPLVEQYVKLVIFKMQFHQNNRSIPGNMKVSDESLAALGEDDVNNWFELSVEMLDYVELILELQNLVYNSMDMSRAHSQTSAGQCRLAPLIPCMLDASCLYDYVVKMLFRLHSALPADVLAGHRDRFNKQFHELKKFYRTSSNLQYFKYLVQIPSLPDRPPNFLEASDFDSYVPMHAVALDAASETGSDDTTSIATLVDLGQSGQPSPPPSQQSASLPEPSTNGWSKNGFDDEKEQLMMALRSELDDLKTAAQRHRMESGGRMEQYENKISQVEHENVLLRESVEAVGDECERYREQAERLQNERNLHTVASSQLELTQKQASSNEEKFKKMKDVYGKLRSEHIDTLKRLGELQKESEAHRIGREQADDHIKSVQQQLSSSGTAAAEAETQRDELFGGTTRACAELVRDAGDELDNPAHLGLACTGEYVHTRLAPTADCVRRLRHAIDAACAEPQRRTGHSALCAAAVESAGRAAELLLHAAATAHDAPPHTATELNALCRAMATDFSALFDSLADRDTWHSTSSALAAQCCKHVDKLSVATDTLLAKGANADPEAELGELMESEMGHMDAAINAAVQKIQCMVDESRARDTGVRLEVNASILDACTSLMAAVRELVRRSRALQEEIVAQGRATTGSVSEFYKKNHKWTEGLLSAAKAVAGAAALLVESADRSVTGSGKLEELQAAAREVAAATAQLVVSSKVKAERGSERMAHVATASAAVASCTAAVIGTVKEARLTLDDNEAMVDFASLSSHAAKQEEFALQVRVLELEAELSRQRTKLGEIRRRNYCNDDDDNAHGAEE